MKVSFAALHPLFGTKNNRKSLAYQQRSPYYWWWAYLRRNEKYIACCASGGEGELVDLYKDFGDVRSEDFYKWWTEGQRGAELFGYKHEASVKVLASASEWDSNWTNENMLVVAFPLTSNKRYLRNAFAEILKKQHTAKRGRTKDNWSKNNANYKINRNFTKESLQTALYVYDAYVENLKKEKKEQLTFWQLGEMLKLVPTAMPKANDTREDKIVKRNTMAVSVNRYIKQAKRIVEGTALGKFPL